MFDESTPEQEKLLKRFAYEQIKEEAPRAMSKHYYTVAYHTIHNSFPGELQKEALMLLWHAKNAAVATFFNKED